MGRERVPLIQGDSHRTPAPSKRAWNDGKRELGGKATGCPRSWPDIGQAPEREPFVGNALQLSWARGWRTRGPRGIERTAAWRFRAGAAASLPAPMAVDTSVRS